MARLILALALASALAGCSMYPRFGRHRDSPQKPTTLTDQEKATWTQRWAEDSAYCTERGYALQTYSSSFGVYQGSGGGYGSTQFNRDVFVNCMEARGWPYEGRGFQMFGTAIF